MTNKKQTNKTTKFFLEEDVLIKLSQFQIYEIMSGLWLQQQEYGFDAPNQTPTKLRKKFKELLSEKK